MSAFNAKRDWLIGTTDIRQAFVLAKWRGQPVAQEPPGIAYELGIAQPGDMWLVEPYTACASRQRFGPNIGTRELLMARWKAIVTLKLDHRQPDLENGQREKSSEPLGYLLVYIDDQKVSCRHSLVGLPLDGSVMPWTSLTSNI